MPRMIKPDRQKFVAGVVLVLIGLGFYLNQQLKAIGSEVIMLMIGSAFLIGYFYQKAYSLLVPACILLGLGIGGLLQDRYWWANEGTQLGLGIGFLAIYLIDRLYQRESHWWPLIPGIILVVIGIPKTKEVMRFAAQNWALILIAIGLLVLVGAFRRQQEPETAPAQTAPQAEPPPPDLEAATEAETAPDPEGPVEPRVE